MEGLEHNFGRWRVVVNGTVVTRYFDRKNAEDYAKSLRQRAWGSDAHVVDGGYKEKK